MFVGRQEELEQIKSLLNNNNKKAIMLYGKRRVGKSTLILEAIKDCSYKIIYYECLLTTLQENIKNLERKVQETFNNKFLHFETLADIFDFLGKNNEKIVVILDEYSYLKSLAPKYYVDSLFQSIIDQMNDNLSLILLGSYVGMMKELLEKENPLFGRFSLILNIKPFDYLDSSLFYKSCSVQQKIEFYSVFGGTPFSCNFINSQASLQQNIIDLLLNPNGILRLYIENILLSELSKIANANSLLSALSNGKKKYTEIENILNLKSNGNLDKQLKNMIEIEVIRKVFPINKRNDKKKTFYEISDNLVRFYYHYVYKNKDVISRIGEDAYFINYIEPSIKSFISHRFEEIVREYFSRLSRNGVLNDVTDIGSYWYDIPELKKNGEFDIVLKHKKSYSLYEVKYYSNPLTEIEADKEYKQIKEIKEMPVERVGFVCLSGFSFKKRLYDLIPAEALYKIGD